MHIQVTIRDKSLTTHITDKGFMASVDHVHIQGISRDKSLTTHIADKGFMANVDVVLIWPSWSAGPYKQ